MEFYGDKNFTFWYGVYKSSTRTLLWSGGGHPDSLIFEPDEKGNYQPFRLPASGPMMGMMEWDDFTTESRQVPIGSRLFVYSDGCVEISKTDGADWTTNEYIEFMTNSVNKFSQEKPISPGEPQNTMVALLQYVRLIHGSDFLDDDFSIIEATFG